MPFIGRGAGNWHRCCEQREHQQQRRHATGRPRWARAECLVRHICGECGRVARDSAVVCRRGQRSAAACVWRRRGRVRAVRSGASFARSARRARASTRVDYQHLAAYSTRRGQPQCDSWVGKHAYPLPAPEKGQRRAFAPFHAQLGPLQVTMARFYGVPGSGYGLF
eukprot:COSAG02_NODE_3631_length_6449_cov_7.945827_5_plen_166_part_00